MSSSTWREHFKDRLDGWEPTQDGSVLEVALLEERLSESDYMEWAQKTHFWPLLQGGFFTAHEPNPELLRKRSLNWSRTLIPVAEWDEVLIVAGLEAPESLPEGCAFVLARMADLSPWWEELKVHLESSTPTEDSAPVEQPEGIMISTNDAPAPALSFADLKMQKIDLTLKPAASAPAPVQSSTKIETNAEGEKVEVTSISFEATENLTKTNFGNSAIDELTMTRTSVEAPPPMPSTPVNVTASSTPMPHHQLIAVSKRPGFNDQAQQLLTQMGAYFSKSLIFGLTEATDSFVPFLWADQFGVESAKAPVPLNDPSIFAIVANTEKPYHGIVIPNPVNDSFFAHWNSGQTPPHVTIVPIFFDGRMVGAAMGFAEEAQELGTLRATERFSLDFTKKLGGYQADEAA